LENDDELYDQDTWFYCSFVKPGRHDYVVRYTWINPDRDPVLDEKGVTMPTILGKLNLPNLSQKTSSLIEQKRKAWNKELYLHEFIGGFRAEDVPICKFRSNG
jgi:hypothetical protein